MQPGRKPTATPAIVTIGSVHGGVRGNIIPDTVELTGTVRALDAAAQKEIHQRIRRTAESIAQSAGATATVTIVAQAPVTYNDPALTERMSRTLRRVAGEGAVSAGRPKTVAEDFAFYEERVPGMYFFLGVTPKGADRPRSFPTTRRVSSPTRPLSRSGSVRSPTWRPNPCAEALAPAWARSSCSGCLNRGADSSCAGVPCSADRRGSAPRSGSFLM